MLRLKKDLKVIILAEFSGNNVLLNFFFLKKKHSQGENNAKEISDALPFIEYEVHRQLINKLKTKGMNALFGLQMKVSLGDRTLIGTATATACFLSALPAPARPRLLCSPAWQVREETTIFKWKLLTFFSINKGLIFSSYRPTPVICSGRSRGLKRGSPRTLLTTVSRGTTRGRRRTIRSRSRGQKIRPPPPPGISGAVETRGEQRRRRTLAREIRTLASWR